MSAHLPVEALLTPEARVRLLHALLAHAEEHGITVERHQSADRHGGGFYSREGAKVVVSPRDTDTDRGLSVLSHELGHAKFDKSMLGHFVQDPWVRGAAHMAPMIGAVIAAVAEGSFRRRLALSAGTVAALQIPLLSGEAVADIKGYNMLKEHGASPELLALHRKEMRHGLASYLRPGAHGLGASALFSAASSIASV